MTSLNDEEIRTGYADTRSQGGATADADLDDADTADDSDSSDSGDATDDADAVDPDTGSEDSSS